jgi:hypothetical protein
LTSVAARRGIRRGKPNGGLGGAVGAGSGQARQRLGQAQRRPWWGNGLKR